MPGPRPLNGGGLLARRDFVFSVPKSQERPLKLLVEMNEDQRERLLAALRTTAPRLQVEEFASELGQSVPEYSDHILEIATMLVSMYVSVDDLQLSPRQFAEGLVKAAEKGQIVRGDQSAEALRAFFTEALRCDDTLGFTAKALNIAAEHERVFLDARILTDLRPVFRAQIETGEPKLLMLRQLKISYLTPTGEKQEVYFALDDEDLRSLREVLQREERKEQWLQRLLEQKQLTPLNPAKKDGP